VFSFWAEASAFVSCVSLPVIRVLLFIRLQRQTTRETTRETNDFWLGNERCALHVYTQSKKKGKK
jgi:hypothetical protein